MKPTSGFVLVHRGNKSRANHINPSNSSLKVPELLITSAQRRALKARAHQLKPVVLLGGAGFTDAVLHEIDRALTAHELVKVKVPDDDRAQREHVFSAAAEKLSAAKVQSIGKTIVLFRPSPESGDK
ncbi:MAG: ribosome assembly RNA-binding protein YhbY [Burkholderiaceae bacterium]